MPSKQMQEWIASGRHERLLGRRVFVRSSVTAGRPPLLLIHGYPTSSYDWHRVWDALGARYSLYALDLLGFGLSEKPRNATYAIAGQADLCAALLEHAAVTGAHVIAHDYGVTVAQELLARAAEQGPRFASVAFLNGGLFPETHRPRRVQTLLASPLLGPLLAQAMSYTAFARTMREIGGRSPPDETVLRDLWSTMTTDHGKRALGRLIDYMRQRREHRERWVGALIDTKVPRTLICGAVDPVSGRHLAERYRELVPDPSVLVLEEVGHYPQLEAPEAVLRAYFAFREGLG